jgi:hypothetical protein
MQPAIIEINIGKPVLRWALSIRYRYQTLLASLKDTWHLYQLILLAVVRKREVCYLSRV